MHFKNVLKGGVLAGLMAMAMAGSAYAATLHISNGGEPASLDPHRVSGTWENRIVGDYLEGLMTEDAAAEAIPGAAESYEISDDGLVYTFHLRDGAVWSDGVPVTADDFVFAFQRLMNPETAAGYAYPVPKHAFEAHGDNWIRPENIVANGPYIPVEWLPGSHIKSVKNETYYDAANVQIDEVMYYPIDDLMASVNRYRAGEFDMLTDFPADQLSMFESNHPGEAHVAPYLGVHYYVFNQNAEKLQDVNVRKALSMSINREIIGSQLWGTGEVAAYSWVPPGTANYDGAEFRYDWADMPYNERVEEAKALLEGAGFGASNPLEVEIKYNTNDNHQRLAVAIAAMWEQLGVTTSFFNSEVAVHYDALQNNDFDSIGRAGWIMDYNDPINMLDLLKSGIDYNYGRYSNPEFDALLNASTLETDIDARAQILLQAETMAMEDYAALPLAFYVSRNVVSPRVSGFVDNASDIHRTRWLSKSD